MPQTANITLAKVALVVAVAENGAIGRNNALPWYLPADLKYFRAVTMNKPVIMGRKTFQSIGRPLPGRDNIVISHARNWSADGVVVVPSFDAAVDAGRSAAKKRGVDEIAVIGGAQIYALALPEADKLYLTEVKIRPEADTFFPPIDHDLWQEVSRDPQHQIGDFPAHDFVIYERKS